MLLSNVAALGTTGEEIELYDANGPFWYRGWATDPESKACVDVEKVLARTGTRRMIMGHTPDFTVRLRSFSVTFRTLTFFAGHCV
jgi:hypothetical protein